VQADTVLPQLNDPQQLNRFGYARNNPLKYTDSTGHMLDQGEGGGSELYSLLASNPIPTGWTARDTGVVLFTVAGLVATGLLAGAMEWVAAGIPAAAESVAATGTAAKALDTAIKDPKIAEAIPKTTEAVIGRFPAYVDKAMELGANSFQIPTEMWTSWTAEQQWAANKMFLDTEIALGHSFVLASPLEQLGGFFQREVEYLIGLGCQLQGDRLIPPGP
jgi:hypothetical protein